MVAIRKLCDLYYIIFFFCNMKNDNIMNIWNIRFDTNTFQNLSH
jgi:hypothetical protein